MGGAHISVRERSRERALSELRAVLERAIVPGVSMVSGQALYEDDDGLFVAYAYVKSPRLIGENDDDRYPARR